METVEPTLRSHGFRKNGYYQMNENRKSHILDNDVSR